MGAGHAMATSNQRNLISDQIAGGEPVQNCRETWNRCTVISTSRIHNGISRVRYRFAAATRCSRLCLFLPARPCPLPRRSEEHTSELQSLTNIVCRLLL